MPSESNQEHSNHIVEERDEEIVDLSMPIEHLENGLLLLTQKLQTADRSAAGQRAAIEQRDIEIDALKNSYSWRITAPLRGTLSLIATPFKLITLTTLSVAQVGGMKNVLIGIVRVVRREGWSGIPQGFSTMRSLVTDFSPPDVRAFEHQYVVPAIPLQVDAEPETATPDRSLIPKVVFDEVDEGFTPFRGNPVVDPQVRLIAFYLPQFHPFPQNDLWWGKGFTEWSNVGKALPNFAGHYQPHCPIHLGYYDLRVPEVMEAQAELAKQYGISGFNYYFYWFGGTILMDSPLESMLHNPAVDIPFCLTWANENWTRRWDGAEHDVLIEQEHSANDSRAFIAHLLRYFRDERYIKIDGKPVLCVYRVNIIPDILATVKLWRQELSDAGYPGLYLICAQTFGVVSPIDYGFDAAMEFPPHTIKSAEYQRYYELANPNFSGKIYSYDEVVRNAISSEEPEFKKFRTAMLSWDNTARKQDASHIFQHFSLLRYKQWLSHLVNQSFNNTKYPDEEKIVFVNAWNEWAEGTHLEPDRKIGYGYLQSTYDVIANYNKNVAFGPGWPGSPIGSNNQYAVIVHIHYQDLWPEIRDIIRNIETFGCDVYVSITNGGMVNEIRHALPNAYIKIVENRGRDILPFASIFGEFDTSAYRAVCKLHSKKSSYREDGSQIRKDLFDRLAGNEQCVKGILARFESDSKLGMLVPTGYLIPHTDHNMTFDRELVKELEKVLDFRFSYDAFPAGSMFWFRPEALESIRSLRNDAFPVEDGLSDGTLAHAIERSLCILATSAGFSVEIC